MHEVPSAFKIEAVNLTTAIAYGGVIVCGSLIGALRRRYLIESSSNIELNAETHLRSAWWAYSSPVLGLIIGIGLGHFALAQSKNGVFIVGGAISLLMLCGSAFLFRSLFGARLSVSTDKLVYTQDGRREEITASDVIRVKILWFSFLVGLRWQRTVRVPTTFKSSTLILAFLRQAIARNKSS